MKHRHLEYPAGTGPEDLPSAAIVDILDRGDLQDWLPLARAVAAQPNGALAERIAALVDALPMYGTSPLWRAWIDRRRVSVAAVSRDTLTLPELRRRRGLSQADVALRLGIPSRTFRSWNDAGISSCPRCATTWPRSAARCT